jgi:chaperone modulatory protein CbpM
MTTIHYRNLDDHGYSHKDLVEDNRSFDLSHFAAACGQSPEWVLQLLEYDILKKRAEHHLHQFFGEDISRAQQAYRLQRDFDASFSAVAMMLDLIDEVCQLRRDVKHAQFKHC